MTWMNLEDMLSAMSQSQKQTNKQKQALYESTGASHAVKTTGWKAWAGTGGDGEKGATVSWGQSFRRASWGGSGHHRGWRMRGVSKRSAAGPCATVKFMLCLVYHKT